MRAQVAESGCGTVWAERCSVWHAYSSASLVGHHLALLLTSLRLGMPRPGGAAPQPLGTQRRPEQDVGAGI